MTLETRLTKLERQAPPPAPPARMLTDEEARARFKALLARLGGELEPGHRSDPPLGLLPLMRALERSAARGSARPGEGRLGDHWSEETIGVLLALVERYLVGVKCGVWPAPVEG